MGPSVENIDEDPHRQPYPDSHPRATPEEHKLGMLTDVRTHTFILNILLTSKLIGEIVVSGTHPRFISKYVFMRMHITGSIGTNGQMNPGGGAAERCNIKLPVV